MIRSSLTVVAVVMMLAGSAATAPVAAQEDPPPMTEEPIGLMAPVTAANLVATHHLSTLVPPSPDSAGIAYIEHRDNFLVTDSEVDEMPIFQNVNLFEIDRHAVLQRTGVSLPWTDEPTGASYNPTNRHLYVTADNSGATVFDVDPGPDGTYGTGDDTIETLDVRDHGVRDAEGLAYDPVSGHLFVAGGTKEDVHEIDPGPDGLFNGVGETTVGFFDLRGFGPSDTEGIAVNPFTGTLLVLDNPSRTVYEVNKAGLVLREIDVSAALAPKLAGIVLAPASDNSGAWHMFIVARGLDNNSHPTENDGTLYEMSLDFGPGGPVPPIADAGSDIVVGSSQPTTLDASGSSDPDGHIVEYVWRLGGTVIAGGVTAQVSLPSGDHVIELTVTDWQGLTDTDELRVTVTDPVVAPPPDQFVCPTISMPFIDVIATSYAFADIACLYELGVTNGVSATSYGPSSYVTREQMASLLARLYAVLFGSPAEVVPVPFTDVLASSFARDDIGRIYGLEISRGTSATTYSPAEYVTREQMAAFIVRLVRLLKGVL